ncbi:MAG: glycosyltransferase family 4 protein [Vicinamibacterales bacterium]
MSRLAWFTPLPPSTSGVARYSAELLPGLSGEHEIDVFVESAPEIAEHPAGTRVFGAHDFVWKHDRQPYDLVVYQIGNASCHDYMWGYFPRHPGLAVLHDGQLHHARALSLRTQSRHDDYLEEFLYSHPVEPDIAELGIAGLLGPLLFLWPMRRVVLDTAKLVVVHNRWLADRIREERPETPLSVVDMGVAALDPGPGARERVRARYGIPDDAIVFAALGAMTPEKRIPEAIGALAASLDTVPNARLMLVGQPVSHYDPRADARAAGVEDKVSITGFVPHEKLAEHLAAADVCLCLRWPTSRETSAAWLRCLSAGRATVVTDLAHMVDIPTLDPRTWTVIHGHRDIADGLEPPAPVDPVAVSVDVLDEEHSLMLAMRRLGNDHRLRRALGDRSRELWQARFRLEAMVETYRGAISAALSAPARQPGADFPAHLLANGTAYAAKTLRKMGVATGRIEHLWSNAG